VFTLRLYKETTIYSKYYKSWHLALHCYSSRGRPSRHPFSV